MRLIVDKVCSNSQENSDDKQSIILHLSLFQKKSSVHTGGCDKNVADKVFNSQQRNTRTNEV